MPRFQLRNSDEENESGEEELGGQMSFLEHLDELRKRLIRSIVFVFVAAMLCWFVSDRIYRFLAVPVEHALAEAQRRQVPINGLTGNEKILPLTSVKENDVGRYIFPEETKFGASVIPAGVSVTARATKDSQGVLGLFTDEPLYAGATIIPKGVRLPVDFTALPDAIAGLNDKLIVTSAIEPFSLYVKVSLYAALCLSVPFLLWQIWAFVSPGLYPHERAYVTPFIALSSISFVLGAMFAAGVIAQILTARWPVTREFEAGMGAMVLGLGAEVVAVWLRSPSLALFIAGGVFIGAGAGAIFRGAIGTVMSISSPDRMAESLAGMFLSAFVGISLPVVGVGIALSRHVSPRVTLLSFAVVVSAGIAASAINLAGRPTTVDATPSDRASNYRERRAT